jgi:lysine 2,3-aminomutase
MKAIPLNIRAKSARPKRQPHRELLDGAWWHDVPAWREIDEATFLDHRWQNKHSANNAEQLSEIVAPMVDPAFLRDMEDGLRIAMMAIRLSPYLLSLVDWDNPYDDPIRRQFIPLGSEAMPDHPMCSLDSLAEQDDSVVEGLVHRYPDKVLFLALDVCPVYCRYCTRSYSIGGETEVNDDKTHYRPNPDRWQKAFEYLAEHDEVEDVVVSGGDAYLLPAKRLKHLGEQLLRIPHIRRIRFATKGLAVMPQKVMSDEPWTDALTEIVDRGRSQGVHVCVHTHFNHPAEVTEVSRTACNELFQRGITVRNQSVLIRDVNDDADTMAMLVKRLSWINVQPYYVYIHDMVPGVETLRTTVGEAKEVEKQVRGRTAGFMTPTFVCDVMGGGGKRDLHSHEVYDEDTGIAVYRSPAVDEDRLYFYFDPLRNLTREMRSKWRCPDASRKLLRRAADRVSV